ncbi:hypothetical protein HYH03_012397 [Edaphochlamys debaryana]|uniref:Protein kinase domain-containing protein n=1 Tax=Edaphochlamys debaryana TaxID=47281 RepID=A0A835XVL7_9CHLO|nr:hypothetical protein HYH03_012397 [Edaphochlamys debaryana]|eukprot:KAG2489171.1 hypothetical protein HYH03_012397 [Edaphochlamys debaryana]
MQGCVRYREAGLPLAEALVNLRAQPRSATCLASPSCSHAAQNASLVVLTYRTTRLADPVTFPEALRVLDYDTDIPTDSTLASQNILYGGYSVAMFDSWCVAERTADPACTKQRPANECVEELLKRGQAGGAPPPAAAATTDDGSPDTAAIVGGVVGGTVGLALLVAAGVVLHRRRRARRGRANASVKEASADVELGRSSSPRAVTPGKAAMGSCGLHDSRKSPSGADSKDTGGSASAEDPRLRRLGSAAACQQPYTDLSARLPDGTPLGSVAEVVAGMKEAVEAAERAASQIQHSPEAPDGAPAGGLGSKPPSAQSGDPAAPPTPPPAPAEELGQLCSSMRARVRDVVIRLECVIGAGSFGTVYKGTWQGLPVAVKTLVFSANADNRQRALQEAALCESISHPNIIATYTSELQPLAELNSSDWRLYIVQEFADGGPLLRLYGKKSIWPCPNLPHLPAIVGLALGIARALDHLHSKRIIHGDLNPNNVLLKRDVEEPSGYVVKVADLGLSMLLPEDHTHLSNRRSGTMFYMAPEVVMGAQLGPAGDVFSLGVMLWELAAGRGAGVMTPAGPRYHASFPSFGPTCPSPYSTLALACLQRQPRNRPSAAFVVEALGSLMDALMPA